MSGFIWLLSTIIWITSWRRHYNTENLWSISATSITSSLFFHAIKVKSGNNVLHNCIVYGSFLYIHSEITLHERWSFPLKNSSVNSTKFAVSCGFCHIYWWNSSLFVHLPRRHTIRRRQRGIDVKTTLCTCWVASYVSIFHFREHFWLNLRHGKASWQCHCVYLLYFPYPLD